MPWTTSDRRSRLPADWPTLRAACRQRAGGRCQAVHGGARCARAGNEAHHAGARDDHADLVWLCSDCHRRITLAEAAAARAAMYARARRPKERHPGT